MKKFGGKSGFGTFSENETEPDEPMERIVLVKQEAHVYKIPANQLSGDFKATEWSLDRPDWTGKLKVMTKGGDCCIRLFDKGSSKLYAECPVAAYPGPAVQSVSDSSRYFVIAVNDSHLGLGFADRSDSFDLNVALQNHFKGIRVEEQIAQEEEKPLSFQDLSLKEGQTIKVNINMPKKDRRSKSPMAGGRIGPPPSAISDAMAASGIKVEEPKLKAPPAKAANPNWIQF